MYVFVFYLSATKVGRFTFSAMHVLRLILRQVVMSTLNTFDDIHELHLWPIYRN